MQAHRQQLQQQKTEQEHQITQQLRQAQAQLEGLQQQQQEIEQTLAKSAEIEAGLEHLRQARSRLLELDQLQMKATPLQQRRQQIQVQIDRAQARLVARLEELQSLQRSLVAQQQRQPHLQDTVLSLAEQIAYLEKRRVYQEQVREKGLERRAFLERLQEQQRECERELAELDHKVMMLQRGVEENKEEDKTIKDTRDLQENSLQDATINSRALELGLELDQHPGSLALHPVGTPATVQATPTHVTPTQPSSFVSQFASFPPCPLCDRPLDEHHWQLVLQKHQAEHEDILSQLWVLREQLTTSDREIRVLRQEYREVEKELGQYNTMLERRGQLLEQLQGTTDSQTRLQQIVAEQAEIERSLHQGSYATDLHEELCLLEQSLSQFNYDDKDHALTRGQVDRWRWAEIKYGEMKQAQKRHAKIAERFPELEAAITHLEKQLAALATSPLQQQLEQLDQQIAAIGYSLEQHTALRQALRQAQPWQLRYRELTQAQYYYPQVRQRVQELHTLWTDRTQALQRLSVQVQQLEQEMHHIPDADLETSALESRMQQQRVQLDDQLSHLGRIQQQRQQLEVLSTQHAALSSQLQISRRQLRIYQELSQAFGKNGIQALMIENILPQLEAETNQILGRLSANQLHVQFVTQRAKRGATPREAGKLIDTLDILISDMQGTRPYETYSGGEAFRVNFAIRLALARLLAQRSGTALQLLVIDEGFGTQDEAGCDRLIGAINAIAADFACILTVTHMPHLKAAFQTRIEVYKTEQGSQISLTL
ncbi:MAG: SMC family ATPase [Leptolyngbyaceae cyanobacterium CRU_2_3]|nr:SMC family ATPase [Leptolyngbyaceae cyanobacterium CRU_2_3]